METSFPYTIIYSKRKTIAIQIKVDGSVILRAPERCPRKILEEFLEEKTDWVIKKRTEMEKYQRKMSETAASCQKLSEEEKKQMKEEAKAYFSGMVRKYADLMAVSYGKVTVREQKTRWGSCSAVGNLSFNWRLMLAPEFVRESVVVHELAHRKEMNHSARFYREISKILPDYERAAKWLKEHGRELWLR